MASKGPARWPLVLIAVLFVGLGVTALVNARGDGDDEGSKPVPTTDAGREVIVATTVVPTTLLPGDPQPIVPAHDAYALTYRVEGFTSSGGAIIDLEHRSVRPPYASRVETVPAESEDAEVSFLQLSDFGVLQTGREGENVSVLLTEPTVAPGDARVAVDIDEAVAAGLLEWRNEERTILDRRCQVFRSGGPIDVATLAPAKDDSWADLCIGDDGLVLQEEWVIGGHVFRRRTAVEIDDSPRLSDNLFEPTVERPEGNAAGTLAEVTGDSRPPGVTQYELTAPPPGFRHRGRYGYSPPRAQVDVGAPASAKVALIVDVYEDGDGGIVVVSNGGTSDNSATVLVGDDDTTVDLDALGTGEIVLGLRQNEVRVGLPRGRFLRVYGTLPAADLATLARSLRANDDPGGTVTAK